MENLHFAPKILRKNNCFCFTTPLLHIHSLPLQLPLLLLATNALKSCLQLFKRLE